MFGLITLRPGHALYFDDAMVGDGVFDLRQERFQRFKCQINRLIQGLIQRRAGEGAGFLIPLRDVELFVQCDQGGGHGIDNAVEINLKAGEFFLDFASYLHFKFELAIGMAGFFCQRLGLIVGCLCFISGAFELLLTRFDTREHGIERFSEAADFIVIARFGL